MSVVHWCNNCSHIASDHKGGTCTYGADVDGSGCGCTDYKKRTYDTRTGDVD